MPNAQIISTKEAAEILGVSDSRIRQLVSSEELSSQGTFGKATMLRKRDVMALARLRAKAAKSSATEQQKTPGK